MISLNVMFKVKSENDSFTEKEMDKVQEDSLDIKEEHIEIEVMQLILL